MGGERGRVGPGGVGGQTGLGGVRGGKGGGGWDGCVGVAPNHTLSPPPNPPPRCRSESLEALSPALPGPIHPALSRKHRATPKKKRAVQKRKPARTNPKGRKRLDQVEKRPGGALRAFFHDKLPTVAKDEWQDRGALFERLRRDFKTLSQEEQRHYKALGAAATLAGKHGGRPFADPSTVSGHVARSRSSQALVTASSEQERLALSKIAAAEKKAMFAQRLVLARERTDAVDLQAHQSRAVFPSHEIVDTLKVATWKNEVMAEPGHLCAGKWPPQESSSGKGGKGQRWVLSYQDKSGARKNLCRGYSSRDGCKFANCRFEHLCPVPGADGRPCLGKHPAYEHKSRASN